MSMLTPVVQSRDGGSPEEVGEVQWQPLRVAVVGLCFLLNMLDGTDLLIMSFIAPHLAADWNISPERLGAIFSASLAGMAVGCLFIAPLADRFGRRTMIMAALALVGVAMVASGQAHDTTQLMIARFFVGIGVGTIGVSMTAMASEYAPPRYAGFAVGFVQAGWPLGSVITAFVAASLISDTGWQILLTAIGILSFVLLAIVAIALPESLTFLQRVQPRGALPRINRLRRRLALAPFETLPEKANDAGRLSVTALFADGRAKQSAILWLAVTFGYFVLYFAISWIPKLSAQAGLPVRDAIYAGATYNVGAFIGTSAIGWLAVSNKLNRVTAIFLGIGACAMIVFGAVPVPVAATLFVAMLVGMTVGGGFNGFWGLAASLYPAHMRGTGIGWALGVGRIGAVLGPIVGGALVGAGMSNAIIFSIYAVPLVLAAALCLGLRTDVTEVN
ncbi:MFS transporter [Sphingomonas donggukensis]|uniref:MFS transporter n=1 Tax=Sphingomonas donggukensis TaxID=2949093 RepID=A0ABY4TS59_9SPHN|nr:MFS transporter [Sphingomonas donggukensis]URW75097.1 MFS transporter [Sphingomonas donggukensis]